jgi:hypothetical protein
MKAYSRRVVRIGSVTVVAFGHFRLVRDNLNAAIGRRATG